MEEMFSSEYKEVRDLCNVGGIGWTAYVGSGINYETSKLLRLTKQPQGESEREK